MDHNPYLSPPGPTNAPEARGPTRHSGLGIASFLAAVTAALAEFILMFVAGFLEISTPGGIDEDSPVALGIGLGIFGGGFLNLVSLGLGIAALFQRDRKKLFAILGVVFGVAALATLSLMCVVGVAMNS